MGKYICIILLLAFAETAAQEKVLEGSFRNLAGITAYDVIFDYTDIKVAHFETEEIFLADKMGKREGQKAEDFKAKWFADREANYEPKFIAYFNKRMEKAGVTVNKNTGAKYTMLVKTVWLYPGYNVGIGREEAKITALITVYETANPANKLLVIAYDKSIGLEPDPDTSAYDLGNRIAGAYEKLAKNLTIQLKRFVN